MDNKPAWLQFIQDTIGIPTCIGFILGIPAMIALIATIWKALSIEQQIVVSACAAAILCAVGLYIYGRVRKTLYKVPPLLYRIRCRYMELVRGLTVSPEVHGKALTLLTDESLDSFTRNILSNLKITTSVSEADEDTIKLFASKVLDSLKAQTKTAVESDPATIDRMVEYYFRASGSNDRLVQDKLYTDLNSALEKILCEIPTEEITLAVKQYLKEVKTFETMAIAQSMDEGTDAILPLKSLMDLAMWPTNMETKLSAALAKVREAIDKYYKGR
jgi:transcriptional regulator NrdR family protein